MLTAGTLLKRERIAQGFSIEDVAAATKINKAYIAALEKDTFEKFPSSVYAKGFLQSYAKFLNIDVGKVIALYRRTIGETTSNDVRPTAETIRQPKFILTPSVIVVSFIVCVVILTVGYLFYQFYNFQKPPSLVIERPEQNSTYEDPDITIAGSTDPGMFITFNDEPVHVQEDGSFEASVTLSSGSNTIIVKSRHPDNIGKEAVLTLNVEYEPPQNGTTNDTGEGSETPSQPPAPTSLDISIRIGQENAWIEVEIDGDQVFASVAPAQSNYSYTAAKSVYVRTGKVSTTIITVNDETAELYPEGGGVASVLCELEDSAVNCRQP